MWQTLSSGSQLGKMLPTMGHSAKSGDMFDCALMGRGLSCCQIANNAQNSPTILNYPTQNVQRNHNIEGKVSEDEVFGFFVCFFSFFVLNIKYT